eukprot:940522-Alexandrium_andersonii.AAC.1
MPRWRYGTSTGARTRSGRRAASPPSWSRPGMTTLTRGCSTGAAPMRAPTGPTSSALGTWRPLSA